MARSAVRDPLGKFSWIVTVDGFSRMGFTQSGTPKYTISTKEYAEGGSHLNPKQIIDRVSYQPITLARGVTNDSSFSKWASGAWDLVQNNAATKSNSKLDVTSPVGFIKSVGDKALSSFSSDKADVVPSSSKYPFSYRRNVKIEHLNRAGIVEVTYILHNCMVVSYQPASDFDSNGDDGLSIETLTLAYEGFTVSYSGIGGTLGNLTTGFIK
jgi:phage tail-like protein